jgi:hypothetical protein
MWSANRAALIAYLRIPRPRSFLPLNTLTNADQQLENGLPLHRFSIARSDTFARPRPSRLQGNDGVRTSEASAAKRRNVSAFGVKN